MEAPETVKPRRGRKKGDIFRKNFDVDDARMCELSRMWHGLFEKHQPDFEAFDPDFTIAFADAWLQKIKDMEAHETDETAVDGLQQTTDEMLQSKTQLMLQMEGIEYFVKKAFVNDGRKLQEFGFEKMRKADASKHWQLPVLGTTLKLVAQHYTTELTAADMPPSVLTDYTTALESFIEYLVLQEFEKRVRIRKTTTRIKKFNELYHIHRQVKTAADVVYSDNPIRAAQFAM